MIDPLDVHSSISPTNPPPHATPPQTYPSLFDLYSHGYLPEHVVIVGYARSGKTDEDLREQLRPYIKGDGVKVEHFLAKCVYRSGGYDDHDAFARMHADLLQFEAEQAASDVSNRLFYFAIPPNVFLHTARSIHATAVSPSGWTRIVVEKPFGTDYESCETVRCVQSPHHYVLVHVVFGLVAPVSPS